MTYTDPNRPMRSALAPSERWNPKNLSIIALVLSGISLIGLGALSSQNTALRQEVQSLRETVGQLSSSTEQVPDVITPDATVPNMDTVPTAPLPTNTTPTDSTTPTDTTTSVPESTTPLTQTPPNASSNVISIQPGQFVQPAFGTKAEVELLKVNRIPNQRNVVNVQFRVHLLQSQDAVGSDVLTPASMTAREPNTTETYEVFQNKGTSGFSLFTMRLNKQPSADGYAWLEIPEGVNVVDIYLPNTQAFKNVPIAPN